MTKDKNLLKELGKLGFPLFESEETQDANATLSEVAKNRDLRLWEGFPVVLATSAERGLLDFGKLYPNGLVAMSLALYRAMNLKFPWAEKLYHALPVRNKKEFDCFLKKLKKDEVFKVEGLAMSSQRLKSTFKNYFRQTQTKLNDLLSVKEELGLEYALSQVFSPKQKELFLKKLKNEKLNKTEREYFSRAVKKKVLALANPELHRLSQKLLD